MKVVSAVGHPPRKALIMLLRPAIMARSLRSWIALAMTIALAPALLSAIIGFVVLERGVIAPIHDIAFRQRQQIEPVQNLRVLVWDTVAPVDEYIEDGDPIHVASYRSLRTDVEAGIVRLHQSLVGVPSAQTLVGRAQQNWTDADRIASALLSRRPQPGSAQTAEALQQFHASIMAVSDRLNAAYQQLTEKIDADYDQANRSYERSIWIACIALAVAVAALVGSVFMIGRILTGSIDRLVAGAARFAEGDRQHRIEVAVPPELSRVADEFNYMIGRIDESEKALAELAQIDSLTGAPNRRAFDTAFSEALSLHVRIGTPATLLSIDIDHFKHINDTWGHPAGDEVLRVAASIMSDNLRSSDRLFRVGGEEFCVLMRSAALDEAIETAERLRSKSAAYVVDFNGAEISFTISIGIAQFLSRIDRDEIWAAADAALYRAKSEGRNRVCIDSGASQESVA